MAVEERAEASESAAADAADAADADAATVGDGDGEDEEGTTGAGAGASGTLRLAAPPSPLALHPPGSSLEATYASSLASLRNRCESRALAVGLFAGSLTKTRRRELAGRGRRDGGPQRRAVRMQRRRLAVRDGEGDGDERGGARVRRAARGELEERDAKRPDVGGRGVVAAKSFFFIFFSSREGKEVRGI